MYSYNYSNLDKLRWLAETLKKDSPFRPDSETNEPSLRTYQLWKKTFYDETLKLDVMTELPMSQPKKTYEENLESEIVMVKMPSGMTFLSCTNAYDETIGNLDKMGDEVENPSPQSTPQVLPSFEEYTLPVTYPKELEETLGTPMEVEPLDQTKLEDVGAYAIAVEVFDPLPSLWLCHELSLKTLGGNTRDLDSNWEETGQDCNFTRSGFKNACIVPGDGVANPSDAVRTYKRRRQKLCDGVRTREEISIYKNSFLGEYECSSLALDREEKRDEKISNGYLVAVPVVSDISRDRQTYKGAARWTLRGNGGDSFWEGVDDFEVDVLRFHTCRTDILGFLEKFRWWFEQDIDGEKENDNEKRLVMVNEEGWMS
ncbi:hypothetical protein Tco_0278070 [Tanacetum coccineum]